MAWEGEAGTPTRSLCLGQSKREGSYIAFGLGPKGKRRRRSSQGSAVVMCAPPGAWAKWGSHLLLLTWEVGELLKTLRDELRTTKGGMASHTVHLMSVSPRLKLKAQTEWTIVHHLRDPDMVQG